MMGAFGMGIIELVFVMLLGGGGGLPLGMPPAPEDLAMYRAAPEDCLYYTTWTAIASPSADSSNATEQLLARPELQQFLKKLDVEIMSFVDRQAMRSRDAEGRLAKGIAQFTRDTITHHAAFFVERVEIAEVPSVFGGFVLKLNDRAAPTFEVIAEMLEENAPEGTLASRVSDGRTILELTIEGAFLFEFSVDGDYLIVGFGEDSLERTIARMQTDVPEWLEAMRNDASESGIGRISTISRINVENIFALIEPMIGGDPAFGLFDEFGLTGIRGYKAITGFDAEGVVVRIDVPLDDEAKGLLELLGGEGLKAEDFVSTPANAPLAVSLNLTPEELLDVIVDLVSSVDPFIGPGLEEGIETGGEAFGANIREDILHSLGDRVTVYASREDGGLLTGWVLSCEVTNHMSLTQVNDRFVEFIERMVEASPTEFHLSKQVIDGRQIQVLTSDGDFMPFTPSWCLTGDELVISLFAPALKSHVRRLSDGENLASDKQLIEALARDDSRVIAVSRLDHAEVIRVVYPWFQMMMQFGMAEISNESGINIDVGDLPSVASLSKGINPGFAVAYRTDEGVLIETRQTIPTGDLGTSVPLMASAIFPATFAARIAAQQTQSANNLKQMGIALHNYHDTYRSFPPPYTVDEEGNPLLSWRVHILPFIEYQFLYDQFHLDEPWDSEHNIKLVEQMPIVYALPGADPTEGLTVYQGVDIEDGIFAQLGMGEIERAKRGQGTRIELIRDGTSNTVLLVETNQDSAIIWSKPGDFEAPGMQMIERLSGNWDGRIQLMMADASVQTLSDQFDTETLLKLFKMNDGGPFGDWRDDGMQRALPDGGFEAAPDFEIREVPEIREAEIRGPVEAVPIKERDRG